MLKKLKNGIIRGYKSFTIMHYLYIATLAFLLFMGWIKPSHYMFIVFCLIILGTIRYYWIKTKEESLDFLQRTLIKNKNYNNDTIIYQLCSKGRLEDLKYLVEEHGMEITYLNITELMIACTNRYNRVAKYVLNKIGDINELDKNKVLKSCVKGKNLEMIKYFIEELNYDKYELAKVLIEHTNGMPLYFLPQNNNNNNNNEEIIEYLVNFNDYELNQYLFKEALKDGKAINIIKVLNEKRHLKANKKKIFPILEDLVCFDMAEMILEYT